MSNTKDRPEASREGAILELRKQTELEATVRYRVPYSHGARGIVPEGARFVVFEDLGKRGVGCLPERIMDVAPLLLDRSHFEDGRFQDLIFHFTNEQIDTLLVRAGSTADPWIQVFPEAATRVEGASARCQDYAEVVSFPGLSLAVVADGAGGVSGGELAAQRVIEFVRARWGSEVSSDRIAAWVADVDSEIHRDPDAGLTTAVVVAVTSIEIMGASVGDSEAWLLDKEVDVLTARQRRKPLIGSGSVVPTPFSRTRIPGWLLVGSDGLFKYTSETGIRAAFDRGDPGRTTDALLQAVRLPSGALHDDVAAIVVRL